MISKCSVEKGLWFLSKYKKQLKWNQKYMSENSCFYICSRMFNDLKLQHIHLTKTILINFCPDGGNIFLLCPLKTKKKLLKWSFDSTLTVTHGISGLFSFWRIGCCWFQSIHVRCRGCQMCTSEGRNKDSLPTLAPSRWPRVRFRNDKYLRIPQCQVM